MALVYITRIAWFLRFKAGRDRQAPTGVPGRTTPTKGILYSLGNVAMPWAMESTRQGRGFVFYLTFALFHLGVVAGITLAFVSTLAPSVMAHPVVATVSGALLGIAFLISVYRVFRRLLRPVMRLISSPDDYFSLLMLTAWFGLGTLTQGFIAGV